MHAGRVKKCSRIHHLQLSIDGQREAVFRHCIRAQILRLPGIAAHREILIVCVGCSYGLRRNNRRALGGGWKQRDRTGRPKKDTGRYAGEAMRRYSGHNRPGSTLAPTATFRARTGMGQLLLVCFYFLTDWAFERLPTLRRISLILNFDHPHGLSAYWATRTVDVVGS